jgi:hypothetical protein
MEWKIQRRSSPQSATRQPIRQLFCQIFFKMSARPSPIELLGSPGSLDEIRALPGRVRAERRAQLEDL